jgi:tRNA(Ile)-lysidine synthase
MPLSGGAAVYRARGRFVLRRRALNISPDRPSRTQVQPAALTDGLAWGGFRFRAGVVGSTVDDSCGAPDGPGPWAAEFDAGAVLGVRAWAPGDRMRLRAGGAARRVKRFLADAAVPAFERGGWPVVLADGAIAWIPGVRRSDAATVRPGRPGVRYHCDRNDG